MKERPILFSAPMIRALLAGTKTVTRRIVNERLYINVGGEDEGENVYQSDPRFGAVASEWATCPYGIAGDRLWVKETHAFKCLDPNEYLYEPLKSLGLRKYGGGDPEPGCNLRVRSTDAMVVYAAHPTSYEDLPNWPGYSTYRSDTPKTWRPSIFMPRWASRITLEVVSVRVERLHEITDEDAAREGVRPFFETMAGIGRAQRLTTGELAADAEYRAGFAVLWDEINGDRALWIKNPWVWRVEFKRIEQARSEAA
jgi:hypothetical protein